MNYWILTQSGNVIARTTVQHVVLIDLQKDDVKQKVKEYDEAIETRLSDANFTLKDQPDGFYFDDIDSDDLE
jgi:hypothetical protein